MDLYDRFYPRFEKLFMTNDKKRGSWFWLIFWLIMFWPMAIVYAIIRSWGKKHV